MNLYFYFFKGGLFLFIVETAGGFQSQIGGNCDWNFPAVYGTAVGLN
jgi:hypothetical protein